MSYYIYTSSSQNPLGGGSSLAHHGILGQKWGIRRFQNKDGSLTAAGKKRYGSSGLTDKSVKQLEKNISASHNKRASDDARRKSRKEVTKTAFDLADKSERLSQILKEARQLESDQDGAWEAWIGDETNVRKTAEGYLKAYNEDQIAYLKKMLSDRKVTANPETRESIQMQIEERSKPGYVSRQSVDSYLKDAGSDAYAHMWEYYCNNNPQLSKSRERSWELQKEYLTVSKDVFDEMLGEYGQKKLSQVPWKITPTVSEYLSNRVNDRYYDYLLEGKSMFK